MEYKQVTFARAGALPFSVEIRKRVMDYFKTNKLSMHANSGMIVKTIIMISLYFIPYALLVSGQFSSVGFVFGMYAVMGVFMAGIGMGVMHDAVHGSYSSNATVNKIIAFVMEIVGGSEVTWKLQHNVLHHTYTNVTGMDEDIAPPRFMRFSPNETWRPIHRFQHWFAWFFYSLMTVSWITYKDYKQMFRYKKYGILKTEKRSFAGYITELTAYKILYWTYAFVLPLIILSTAWYWVLLAFLLMHVICGFILGIVFQPAHVVPETNFPLPDAEGVLHEDRAVHQMRTTSDFAPKHPIITWFTGGLNYQVEHHLFPYICHVHYPKIALIVQATASEYNIPYHVQPSFWSALVEHTRMLKRLGQKS